MTIIEIKETKEGFRNIESQSHRTEVWMEGYALVPSEMENAIFETGGFLENLTVKDGVVTAFVPGKRPEPEPVPEPVDPQIAQVEANVEYLAMMTGIDLPTEG